MNTSEVQLRTVWTQGYWDGLDFIHMCIPRRSKAPYKQLKTKIMVRLKKTVGKGHKMKKSTIQNQAEQTCWCKELHFEHGFFLLVLYVKINLCLLLLCMSSKWQCCLSKHWWRRHFFCVGFFGRFFPACFASALSFKGRGRREHGL